MSVSQPPSVDADDIQVIKATRQCPLHYRPSQLKPIGSRPEDFLATAEQLAVCGEILRRSIHNDWAYLDQKGQGKVPMRANFDSGENSRGRMQTRDTAADAAARVKREMTPRNIHDFRRTEAARKLSEGGTDDSGYSSWHSSFGEKDPGYMGLHGSLPNQRGGVSFTELQQEMQREEALTLHGYQKHSVSDMQEQGEAKS
jgi:hypothetical protein